MAQRKLTSLSISDKIKVLEELETNSRSDVGKKFKISQSTITRILGRKDELLADDKNSSRKRRREAEHPELEECLVKWMKKIRDDNVPISGPMLQRQGKKFAHLLKIPDSSFSGSNGWLGKFKQKHDIVFRQISGEGKDVDEEICQEWKETLRSIIDGHQPRDVFNADETALFYQCLPNKTMCFKGETCQGGKHSKQRVTLLLGANMDGSEKLPPLMIGKSKKPRCFSKVKTLPMEYLANKKAWMTSDLFKQWLLKLDSTMRSQKRHILLFIDNCSAHSPLPKLKNVNVHFLPPNTTSHLQPLDQGIIRNFKSFYRTEVIDHILDAIEQSTDMKINILQAMRMTRMAWSNVAQSTIANCFRKCGFSFETEAVMPAIEVTEEPPQWQKMITIFPCETNALLTFEDFVRFDDDVYVCGQVTDEDIVADVTEPHESADESEEDDDGSPPQNVTRRDAQSALLTLQNFLESKEGVPDPFFSSLVDLQKFVKNSVVHTQSKITSFFAK